MMIPVRSRNASKGSESFSAAPGVVLDSFDDDDSQFGSVFTALVSLSSSGFITAGLACCCCEEAFFSQVLLLVLSATPFSLSVVAAVAVLSSGFAGRTFHVS